MTERYRPTDVQALGGFYFRRVFGCHCEIFRRLSFLPAYKEVVVRLLYRLGASGITAKIVRIKFCMPAGKDDGLFSGSC
jgi:hypothetical protein